MSDQFDPYFKWLGIPPDEQPPHHYRLLGLPLFVNDLDVIENAADQRMAHIRNYQAGKHSQYSQRVLNELSSARVTLLNPDLRAAYDQQLQTQTAASQETSLPDTPAAAAFPDLTQTDYSAPMNQAGTANAAFEHPSFPQQPFVQSKAPARRRSKSIPNWVLPIAISGGSVLILIVIAIGVFNRGGRTSGDGQQPTNDSSPLANVNDASSPTPPSQANTSDDPVRDTEVRVPTPNNGNPSTDSGNNVPPNVPMPTSTSQAGMVGRIKVDGRDVGVLVQYHAGQWLTNHQVVQWLFDHDVPFNLSTNKLSVELQGGFSLSKPSKLSVYHVGGGSTGGVLTLAIDDENLGAVGDDRSGHATYEVELVEGTHRIHWQLRGGDLECCQIQLTDESGSVVPVEHNAELLTAVGSHDGDDKVQLGEPSRSDTARKAAKWILSAGGRIRGIRYENQKFLGTSVGQESEIPTGFFQVRNIYFDNVTNQITGEEFQNLCKVDTVEYISGKHSHIRDGLSHLADFASLHVLDLSLSDQIADESLRHVAAIPNLRELILTETRITDLGFANLADQSTISILRIEDTSITDAAADHLSRMQSIKTLDLSKNSELTEQFFSKLRALESLQVLHLRNCNLSDETMSHISDIPSLVRLYLDDATFNEDGLAGFKRLTKLISVAALRTNLSDKALGHFGACPALVDLSVSVNPNITDAGLDSLVGLKKFRRLTAVNTSITKSGADKFNVAMPNCKVYLGLK